MYGNNQFACAVFYFGQLRVPRAKHWPTRSSHTESTSLPHSNNFGSLRLLFALLVIVSHSPELIDGNANRELLARATSTTTFGSLAVAGFFIISGFLIAGSYDHSTSVAGYLKKRVLRIYPGFLAAYFVSLLIVGPLAGGDISRFLDTGWTLKAVAHALLLKTPVLPEVFNGLAHPDLNGSMWTIPYEFRCYLLVIVLGSAGLLQRRWFMLVLTGSLIVLYPVTLQLDVPSAARMLLGQPDHAVRLLSYFCSGVTFYLFRDRIHYNGRAAIVAAFCFALTIQVQTIAHLAMGVFGAYLVFWAAFAIKSKFLRPLSSGVDVSYGVYLYAYPIQNTLIYFNPDMSPLLLTVIAGVLAFLSGLASWHVVEKHFLSKRETTSTNDKLGHAQSLFVGALSGTMDASAVPENQSYARRLADASAVPLPCPEQAGPGSPAARRP